MRFEDLYTNVISVENDCRSTVENPRKLIICTTPRTAGHHFCQGLRLFGLGVPTEYFQWQYALPLMARWSDDDRLDLAALIRQAPAYGRHLVEKRTANGTFSAKIFYENLPLMRQSIGGDDDGWLYVFLTRRSKTDQTVSLLSTLRTGRTFDSEETLTGVPLIGRIDEKQVRDVALFISGSEANWKRKLDEIDRDRVVTVFSEDFISRPKETMSSTVGMWFPAIDFWSKPMPAAGRYESDALLKHEIRRDYGDYTRSLWGEAA